jgi:outer membrane protein
MPKSVVLFFSLFFIHAANAQEKWDLQKCISYAYANNISIQQQDIQARLAQLTFDQSKLSRIPSLSLGSTLGYNSGRSIDRTTNLYTTSNIFSNSFTLQSSVEVFNFFSKQNTIAANRLEMEAQRATVDRVKNDIALDVAGAYLQILLNREQMRITQVQSAQTRSQLDITRKQVNSGAVPELNAVQLEAQLATDSANVVAAKGAEIQSLFFLKAILGMDAAKEFDISTPPVALIPVESLVDLQPEKVYNLALLNQPLQKVNELKLQAARKNAEAAKGALYPSVGVGGSLQTNYSTSENNFNILNASVIGTKPIGVVKGTNDTVLAPIIFQNVNYYADPYFTQFQNNIGKGIGLNITVPIFNGGTARTNLQRSRLNVRSFELAQQQDNLNLKQDIYKAYVDATTSLEKFNAASKSVAASEKALDYAQKRYNIGLLNTLELINTQSNLFRARLQLTLAQYDHVFKMKVLEFYKGQGLRLQ